MKIIINNEDDLRKIGIYKITNLVNNKFYIGSTRDSFLMRLRKHREMLKSNRHPNAYLQSAYNKYGGDSFEFSILEIIDNKKLILEKEQEYITKLRCFEKNIGYNLDPNVYRHIRSLDTTNKISNTLKRRYKNGEIQVQKNHLIGKPSWNKGIKCPQISETRRKIFSSIEIYDINKNLIVIFRSCIDLCEWSENSNNIIPTIIISTKNKKGTLLRNDKIHYSIRNNIPYKGLYFKRCKPLPPEMGVAKWMNSGKAEMPILSQALDTSNEGATTTGEVKSS
jgi:group I intron endonuclease